uniref:Uncharacterized protein n=1 Tax=Coccidioides posadasii RMSCC 3488 TaxID=454284 RepID=A0A0J6F4H7_COCPO|nr:hypothetical protein CPAG_01410 [Coccidioides posadasii RMSCC 3488]
MSPRAPDVSKVTSENAALYLRVKELEEQLSGRFRFARHIGPKSSIILRVLDLAIKVRGNIGAENRESSQPVPRWFQAGTPSDAKDRRRAGFAFQRRKKQAAEKRGFQPSRVNGLQRLRTDPKSPKRRGPKSKKYPGGRPPKPTGIVALARLLSLMSTTHKELIII